MSTEQSAPGGVARVSGSETTDRLDELRVRGAETVARIRDLIREGNVRRIWIKNEDGRTLIELPSMLGLRGGAPLLPVWAAVGALATAARELTIVVQREEGWPRYDD